MNRFRLFFLSALALILARAEATEEARFFHEQVAPLLEQRCFECHSHEKKIKGGLALDSKPGWEKGGESGAATVKAAAEALEPSVPLLKQQARVQAFFEQARQALRR